MWTLEDVKMLFQAAACLEDFCYNVYDDKIVCGGWNRIYLYPDGTLKASDDKCNNGRLRGLLEEFGIEFV